MSGRTSLLYQEIRIYACDSSIGNGLHHSQELEMHEHVTRVLQLPRPLQVSSRCARIAEATYSSGPLRKAATPHLDRSLSSYRYFHSFMCPMMMEVLLLQL